MDLQADNVQGVMYLLPGQKQDDASKIWEKLFGSHTAEMTQQIPNSPFLGSFAAGEINGRYIVIKSQVGRIGITVNKRPMPHSAEEQLPHRLSNVAEACELVCAWMVSVTEEIKLLRIGFVLELSCDVDLGKESEQLRRLLPGLEIPLNAIDVMAQMNFQTQFPAYPKIKMNRFCQWRSGQMASFQFQMPQVPGMQVEQQLVQTVPIVGLKLDVNSSPDSDILDEAKTNLILNLAEEALAIYQEGFSRFLNE